MVIKSSAQKIRYLFLETLKGQSGKMVTLERGKYRLWHNACIGWATSSPKIEIYSILTRCIHLYVLTFKIVSQLQISNKEDNIYYG